MERRRGRLGGWKGKTLKVDEMYEFELQIANFWLLYEISIFGGARASSARCLARAKGFAIDSYPPESYIP